MFAKRISLSLLAIAMVSLIVSAASFALFTAQGSNVDNTFTAGTVTLNNEWSNFVDVANIAPGDSGSFQYRIDYTGSLEAWLGLDTSSSGDLFTCDGGGRFHIDIADQNKNHYSSNGINQVAGLYNNGQTLELTVNWNLDLAAGNDCQGDGAAMQLLVKAVQSKNNSTATGPISW
jgi:predicted ribosomally synthesized peptide with SipW-like signal peptide